jgi:hypothetical protein
LGKRLVLTLTIVFLGFRCPMPSPTVLGYQGVGRQRRRNLGVVNFGCNLTASLTPGRLPLAVGEFDKCAPTQAPLLRIWVPRPEVPDTHLMYLYVATV